MNRFRSIFVVAAILLAGSVAQAQKAPRIGYVYPAGGQQGQTFEITIGGQFLTGVSDVYCSGPGMEATVLSYQRPLNGKETELLRDRLKMLQEKVKAEKERARRASESAEKGRGSQSKRRNRRLLWSNSHPKAVTNLVSSTGGASLASTEVDEREIAAIQEKLKLFANGRQYNTAIAESVVVRVTLAPDAALGDHEIRVASPGGLSNPLVFCVGQLPEFSESAARASLKTEIETRPASARGDATREAMRVTLPAVLNGQILAGEADRFRFSVRAGQRVLVAVSARKLIPYLPDAVPGWFQSTVALYDSSGRELAYADDFRFNPDPVLCYQFPTDGEYELEIRDAIYRGREDFVYRITVGELPFITSIYPLGGSAGTQTSVELRGWNLSAKTLAMDLRKAQPGLLPLVTTTGNIISNFVPFAVDSLPEVCEKEPNNVPIAANAIAAPRIVNGRIDQAGDVDVFRIEGKAGNEIVAEVSARGLGSPLDSVLQLMDVSGKTIASNDDNEDRGAGLITHHADARLSAKLPADGTYFLHISDSLRSGGADHGYRLRVGPAQPGLELRVVPASLSGRVGEKVLVTVHALRKDGFTGEITITFKGACKGFKLSGGVIPAGQDHAKLTLTLPVATEEPVALELEGRAKIGEREVIQPAIPAEDMEQAFAYHHLVPAKELRVAIGGRLVSSGSPKLVNVTPLQINSGGSIRVEVSAAVGEKAPRLHLELRDPPEGVVMKNVSVTPDRVEFDIQTDAARSVAGEKGRLVVQVFHVRAGATPEAKPRRISLGALPAIPYEIVSAQ